MACPLVSAQSARQTDQRGVFGGTQLLLGYSKSDETHLGLPPSLGVSRLLQRYARPRKDLRWRINSVA